MKRNRIKAEPSSLRRVEERDLAYYIHDRVELLHQVFSLIKPRELKSIAPDSVRNLPIDDLEELCLEELLGISSKRLCAILDGAEPPSDTDSSVQEEVEAISLDSISSDEQFDNPKKKKCKHHSSKKKKKKSVDRTQAANPGVTVLELLELQARARAIRAQLDKEKVAKVSAPDGVSSGDDDDVIVKEVKPEVVELSSDDEKKPDVNDLRVNHEKPDDEQASTASAENSKTVKNNIIVIVPPQKSRRIKLVRTRVAKTDESATNDAVKAVDKDAKKDKAMQCVGENGIEARKSGTVEDGNAKITVAKSPNKIRKKIKKSDKLKKFNVDSKTVGSDDEITLQLSDTEKMDLLEDFDRKQCEVISSDDESDDPTVNEYSKVEGDGTVDLEQAQNKGDVTNAAPEIESPKEAQTEIKNADSNVDLDKSDGEVSESSSEGVVETNVEENKNCKETDKSELNQTNHVNSDAEVIDINSDAEIEESEVKEPIVNVTEVTEQEVNENNKTIELDSDTEVEKEKTESGTAGNGVNDTAIAAVDKDGRMIIIDDDNKLEISDDSSCYEVEGITLSKEPTSEEIEALSAKIDLFEREEVVTERDVEDYEASLENISWKDRYLSSKKVKNVLTTASIFNAVRKKNIELKKKLEMSKKEKKESEVETVRDVVEEKSDKEEGTIEHYNTLEGSTTYIDPVQEVKVLTNEERLQEIKESNENLIKDARQLLKMYKKLLKYNSSETSDKKKIKKKKKKKYKKESDGSGVASGNKL